MDLEADDLHNNLRHDFGQTLVHTVTDQTNASRYWQQRYTIFPYYDDGFYLTHDAWFGVTPEPIAM